MAEFLVALAVFYTAMADLPATVVASLSSIQPLTVILYERITEAYYGKMIKDHLIARQNCRPSVLLFLVSLSFHYPNGVGKIHITERIHSPMRIEELKQWLKIYLKNKEPGIVHLEETADTLFVEYSGQKHLYIIHPQFEDKQHLLSQLTGKEHPITFVVLNTRKNIAQVIAWWDILVQYSHFSIYFVAPKTNEKWSLYPFSHNKLIEQQNLEKGLSALAEGIGYVDE